MQPAGATRDSREPRDDMLAAWSARAASATALLRHGQWAEARAEADMALTELRPPEPLEPSSQPTSWEPSRLAAGQAPMIIEMLLVGLRSAFLLNDLQAAMQFGSAALRTASHFGLPELEARAHNDLAGLYGRRDFQERAFHHLKSGVEVLERAGLPVLPQLLTNLGNVYSEGLRLDEALGCFRRGREGFEQAGDALGAAVARSNEGRLLVQTGKAKQGLVALEEALATFVGLEARAYVGVTLGKIGTARAVAGDGYGAEQSFEKALAALGDEELPFRGEVHEAYGSFLLERGRASEALTEYQRAEAHYQRASADGPAVGMLRGTRRGRWTRWVGTGRRTSACRATSS